MPRTRSRAYPAISLPEAIGRVEKLYEVAAQKPVSRDQAFHGLGFAGANGVSVGVVSAVRKYGLVEKTGQVYRVSRLAVRLIDGKSASDRQTALEEAVKRPNIFAELWGAFRGQDPSPDDLAAYLAGSGFSPTAIPKVVSGFRSSIDFVRHGGRLSAGEKTGSGQGGGRLGLSHFGSRSLAIGLRLRGRWWKLVRSIDWSRLWRLPSGPCLEAPRPARLAADRKVEVRLRQSRLCHMPRSVAETRAFTRKSGEQARGVRMGWKPNLTPRQRKEALARRDAGEPLVDIGRSCDVSHSTISRLRRGWRKASKSPC